MLQVRAAATLLTPHPGEAARLLGVSSSEIQSDRTAAIQRLVALTGATIALKGHATLVQHPGQTIWRNSSGNPAMAAPGMGDVLTGIIAALIAQGMAVEHAAVVGVWLHGQAGDEARRHRRQRRADRFGSQPAGPQRIGTPVVSTRKTAVLPYAPVGTRSR
jgi:ADP-dependent NAD(P)H-hydrate dehydratase / NAD(P)H-hydrate epimerase